MALWSDIKNKFRETKEKLDRFGSAEVFSTETSKPPQIKPEASKPPQIKPEASEPPQIKPETSKPLQLKPEVRTKETVNRQSPKQQNVVARPHNDIQKPKSKPTAAINPVPCRVSSQKHESSEHPPTINNKGYIPPASLEKKASSMNDLIKINRKLEKQVLNLQKQLNGGDYMLKKKDQRIKMYKKEFSECVKDAKNEQPIFYDIRCKMLSDAIGDLDDDTNRDMCNCGDGVCGGDMHGGHDGDTEHPLVLCL